VYHRWLEAQGDRRFVSHFSLYDFDTFWKPPYPNPHKPQGARRERYMSSEKNGLENRAHKLRYEIISIYPNKRPDNLSDVDNFIYER
jgi:hypothetical protein